MNKTGTTDATTRVDEKIDSLSNTVKDIVDQGAQKVEELRTRAGEVKDQAISRGNNLMERASEMVKAHPLRSVGIAFGAGYVLMRLFRR
jgi:ElaB/YqjD/DUF883 family membrane-anchored ribosome-binding protein